MKQYLSLMALACPILCAEPMTQPIQTTSDVHKSTALSNYNFISPVTAISKASSSFWKNQNLLHQTQIQSDDFKKFEFVKQNEKSALDTRISDKQITQWLNRLWKNVAKGHFRTVYHMMTKDYKMLREDGSVFNRKQAINFFKKLRIAQVKDLSRLFVVRSKDCISAYYIRPQRLEGSDEFVDYPLITILQKIHGKWLWKAEPRSLMLLQK